jgi:hypothetical protein
MLKKFCIAMVVIVCIPVPALSQNFSMPISNPVLNNVEFGRQIKSIVDKGSLRRDQQYSPAPKQVSATNLTYKISMQRRQANYKSFVDKSIAVSPSAGAELKGMFAKGDPIQMVGGQLQSKFGFQVNNVADAYALWMIGAWWVVNDLEGELTPAQFSAVKRQVSN